MVINPGFISCTGDLDLDLDVDGADLVTYANSGGSGIDLATFAETFGGVSCPWTVPPPNFAADGSE